MRFKPYGEYNEVDLPWLVEMPSHCEIKKIKHLFDERYTRGKEEEPPLVASQKYGVILRSSYDTRTVEAQVNLESLKFVKEGDFVISLRSFQGGIEYSYNQGIISPAYTVMIPTMKIDSSYFKHLAKSIDFIELLKMTVTGIREGQNIDYKKLKNSKIPLPSITEQQLIGSFLDNKLEKIDEFIEIKTRLIGLLKEQKQAMINKAVTKGLDDSAKMKDSGVEWIGEVPEEWEVLKLKYVTDSNMVSLQNSEDPEMEVDYIDIGSVGFFNLKEEPINYKFKNAPSRARRIVQAGDVIISTVRTYLKSMLYIDEYLDNKIVSTGFSVLTPKDNILSLFLAYALSANYFIDKVISSSTGVAYPAISDNKLSSLYLVVPTDLAEQEEIISYLKKESAKIDRTINFYKKEIDLIKEYRTSLISSVVTGKVDVRNM